MKKKVLAVLAAAALVLVASAAWATPTVNIYENIGSAPLVETTGFASDPTILTATEFANVTTILFNVPVGTYGVKMLEPVGNLVSDFAVLVSDVNFLGLPTVDLRFVSEGATNFDVFGQHFSNFADALVIFDQQIPGAAAMVEDGTLQTLFNFPFALQVNAQSEVATPIPTSAILFGTGLLGAVPAWRLRRKA